MVNYTIVAISSAKRTRFFVFVALGFLANDRGGNRDTTIPADFSSTADPPIGTSAAETAVSVPVVASTEGT